jgi:molybdopterin biosynthesis enzyme
VSDNESSTPRSKWSRSQRVRLTAAGREAERTYRQEIVASRVEAGRKSFDAARCEWAARLSLEPTDGLYLGELVEAPRTIPEIAASLDGYGPQRADVRAAIERLVRVRMLELVAPPSAPPAPPRRW